MFRFTIRDLLWLTVVVGLAIGWWADRRRKSVMLKKMKRQRSVIETVVGHAWDMEIHEYPDGSITFRHWNADSAK